MPRLQRRSKLTQASCLRAPLPVLLGLALPGQVLGVGTVTPSWVSSSGKVGALTPSLDEAVLLQQRSKCWAGWKRC